MASPTVVSSNLFSVINVSDRSIYTNYVNMHLSIDELDDINYTTYASDIKLWLKSQGYVDHITKKK